MSQDDLDDRLLAAHEVGDKQALVTLYAEAAERADGVGATCFYLTHAYIYALDLGDPRARGLHKKLKDHGRET